MATNAYGWTSPMTGNYGAYQRMAPLNNQIPQVGTDMGMNTAANTGGAMAGAQQGNPPQGGNLSQYMMPPSQYQNNPGAAIPQLPNYQFQRQAGQNAPNWDIGNFDDPEFYRNQENSMMADRYNTNYRMPQLNYNMQLNDQQFNQGLQQSNFNAQQQMNQFNMGLQRQAALRENNAFNAGLAQDTRNFGESQYQYRDQAALSREQLAGQNEYNRGQIGIGQQANANNLLNYQNQFTLGQQQNANQLTGLNQQFELGQGQNANTRFNYENQFALGQQANATNQYSAEQQAAFNQGQIGLGQGRLDLDTRGQTLDDRFRYRDLAQQDQLARAQMANQTLNTRYQTFGRAQAPNFRAASGWS